MTKGSRDLPIYLLKSAYVVEKYYTTLCSLFSRSHKYLHNLLHFPKDLIGLPLALYAARSISSSTSQRNSAALLRIYSASAKIASVLSSAFIF